MVHNLNGTLRKDLTTSLSPFSLTLHHLLQLSLSPSSWCDLSSFLTRTNLGKFFLRQELYDGIKSAKYKVQSVSIYNTLLVRVCWQQCVHTHTSAHNYIHNKRAYIHTCMHPPNTHISTYTHQHEHIPPSHPAHQHTMHVCTYSHTATIFSYPALANDNSSLSSLFLELFQYHLRQLLRVSYLPL